MQTVLSAIEHLLFNHEMVIVPSFGAFVRRHRGAQFYAKNLLPPKEIVVFNPDLKDNDGLLATTLMRNNNTTWADTNLEINRFVTDLKRKLETNRPVALGRLGSMVLSHNRLLFLPSDMTFLPQNTGAIILQPQKRLTETITINIRKDILHYAAACFAGLCLLAIPLKTGDLQNTQTATFLQIPAIERTNASNKITNNTQQTDIAEQKDTQTEANTTVEKANLTETNIPKPVANGKFHVIVASIVPDRAEDIVAQLHKDGYTTATTLDNNGLKRVVIASYSTFADARVAMYHTRSNTPYGKAWILQDK